MEEKKSTLSELIGSYEEFKAEELEQKVHNCIFRDWLKEDSSPVKVS